MLRESRTPAQGRFAMTLQGKFPQRPIDRFVDPCASLKAAVFAGIKPRRDGTGKGCFVHRRTSIPGCQALWTNTA